MPGAPSSVLAPGNLPLGTQQRLARRYIAWLELVVYLRIFEAIASRLEAIAGRLEAIASRVEAIASRVEAIAIIGWRPSLVGWRPRY